MEDNLPSDEEILSSPSVSGASDNDEDDDDEGGDSDEEGDAETTASATGQVDDEAVSSSSSTSGLADMMKDIVEKGLCLSFLKTSIQKCFRHHAVD